MKEIDLFQHMSFLSQMFGKVYIKMLTYCLLMSLLTAVDTAVSDLCCNPLAESDTNVFLILTKDELVGLATCYEKHLLKTGLQVTKNDIEIIE